MMTKVNVEANTYVYPNPVTLVGTEVNKKVNFMALGWVSHVNSKPPHVGIGVNRFHFTAKGIKETKTFSINYPSTDMIEVADYCGIVSGNKIDKTIR